MNETRTRGGPNLGLLLLIPVVVIIAKAASRRAMMEGGWGPTGGRPYGHHRFDGADGETAPRTFRLPPRIEAALDAWHARAHEASGATEQADPKDQKDATA
jgi:hypothetical protein